MISRKRLLSFVSLSALLLVAAEARANELYFAMPVNYDHGETDTLFVYGNPGVTGTVSSPSGFSSSFTVGANNVTSVTIPNSYDLTVSGAVTNNGFLVAPTNPADAIGASYLSREPFTTDTTYLFDASALGTSYYAAGYTALGPYASQLTVVGTQAGTTVTVTPSSALTSGQPAGTPFNLTLGQGQAVVLTSSTDVTGTSITSTAPVAVFGGGQCANVPPGVTACDHLLSAVPSVDHYSASVAVPNTIGTEGTDSNRIRILAATNGTVVNFNGVPVATLNAGQYFETSAGTGGLITANNPVLVTEFLTGQSGHPGTVGDPAESYIPGTDQWLNAYVFSTPVGSQAYQTNFLDVVIPAGDIGTSLMLDGVLVPASDCSAFAGTSYDYCNISIAPGAGSITAADPFLLLLDGGTSFDSYFTFAGATYSTGASPPVTPPSTPAPEPMSLALIGVGLAGLAAARRR